MVPVLCRLFVRRHQNQVNQPSRKPYNLVQVAVACHHALQVRVIDAIPHVDQCHGLLPDQYEKGCVAHEKFIEKEVWRANGIA